LGRCDLAHIDSREIAMAAMNGTIKRLVDGKGFGFILATDGNEYFFHNSACAQTPFDELFRAGGHVRARTGPEGT
jgi:cold shock CspA family protein